MPGYHLRAFDPSLPYPALVKDCEVLMAVIKGEKSAIRSYLDQWFKDGTDSERRAFAWSSAVMVWMNYGQVGVEGSTPLSFSDQGSAPYAESALTVPTVVGRRYTFLGVPFYLPFAAAWDMSYIFADNVMSVCTARDVWGYSKTLGQVRKVSSASSSEIHRVRTSVLDQSGPYEQWKWRQVYALRRNTTPTLMLASTEPPTPGLALAPPFTGPDDLVRLAVDNQGGHVWVDDPDDPVDPDVVDRLPVIGLGTLIGPGGPEDLRLEGGEPEPGGDPLPGVPADDALRERLDLGKVAGAALLSVPFAAFLPDIPTKVIGLKQERTCTDPTLAEHRRLTLGPLVAVDTWPTGLWGPGAWRFNLTRNPDSHPMGTDLGIKSQDCLAALRLKCHMRIQPADVEWTT